MLLFKTVECLGVIEILGSLIESLVSVVKKYKRKD
jgi:hypothetical protein